MRKGDADFHKDSLNQASMIRPIILYCYEKKGPDALI